MLHAEQRPRNVVRLTYVQTGDGPLDWIDYNPYLGRVSRLRYLDFELTDTFEELCASLARYPNARIVHTLAHEPWLSPQETTVIMAKLRTINDVVDWKRVKHEGVPVIDQFGFHLYIKGELDLLGRLKDIDTRF